MVYLLLLVMFAILPLSGLAWMLRGRLWRGFIVRIGLIAGLTVSYAGLLLNYLAAVGARVPDPSQTLGIRLGLIPIEDFLFLALQAAIACLLVLWLWRRLYPQDFG